MASNTSTPLPQDGASEMCACPSAFAGTTSEALAALPTIPQPCGYPIDGQLNPAQYLLVGILRTMLLHQLHLHVVERIEIGKAVADRAFQQRIALQQAVLPHDVQKRLDREMPF